MEKLKTILKSRIEPYVSVAIVIVVVVFQVTGVKDDIATVDTKIDHVGHEVAANKAAWSADDEADEKLYMTRFDAIQQIGEELQAKQMVLEGNIVGLRVEATHGAEERKLQLEGRLVVLQQQFANMAISERERDETMRAIQRELVLIRELQAVSDTVVVVRTDTLLVKKKGRWLWFD